MSSAPAPERFSLAQWLLLLLLAAVQFAHVLDFIILMPLATYLQADLNIRTREFGFLVSSYGLAAFLSGLVMAPWLDRFDRKPTLLVLFTGFTLGTFLCALAPDYNVLLAGRIVAGAFGGIAGAVVTAIVGDAFPASRRGAAMGAVMSAFSLASIVGVPAGLFLTNLTDGNWRFPFAALAAASLVVLVYAWWTMPSIAGHLHDNHEPMKLWRVISHPTHVRAFALMLVLVFSGFLVFPFIATFLVKNVGRTERELPLIYLFGGAATLVSMNLIGRLSDRYSRLVVFRVFAVAALVPLLSVTCLPAGTSLTLTLVVTTFLMVLTSGRMVPAITMITSSAAPRIRGSFLSINACVQQLAAGLAPLLAGLFLHDDGRDSPLVGYPVVGLLAMVFGISSLFVAGWLRPAEEPVELPVAEGTIVVS